MSGETQRDDGESAFPVGENSLGPTSPGMQLRDYFAAKAMQSIEWYAPLVGRTVGAFI